MKTLNRKHLLGISLLALSGIILASSYSDFMIQSDAFMSEVQVDEVKRLDEVNERYVASEQQVPSPSIVTCPTDVSRLAAMKGEIEGKWTLNKYKYLANNHMDEEEIYKTVKLSMSSDCEVTVNDDEEQVFNISFLSTAHTMALFKLYGDGHEVLELKKLKEVKTKLVAVAAVSNEVEDNELIEPEKVAFEINLLLESANTPDGHLKSNLVKGSFEVADGYLNIDAVVNFDTSKEREIVISDAEMNGNAFVTGDEDSPDVGIMTANGNKTSYTVRFSTGQYKGITLNFTSEERLDEVIERDNAALEQLELKKEIDERPAEEEMVKVAEGRGFAF